MNLFGPEFWSLEGTTWWFLLIIYVAKVVEITLMTLRIILVNRGFRKLGTFLSFIEIILWVLVASNVLDQLNFMKGLVYALGFSTGVYLGSYVESKLAFGRVLIQAITSEENSADIIAMIRAKQIGVTVLDGEGYQSKKKVLLIYVERNQTTELLTNIKLLDEHAVIGVSDINNLTGGYLPKRHKNKVIK